MGTGIRWTEDQLADFQKRRGKETRAVECKTAVEAGLRPRDSKLERRLQQQLESSGLPLPSRNWFFLPDRDFELDFAWATLRIAVEVQGMAHRIKGKFTRDIEKRALAMLDGWRVLEVDGASIRDGRALEWIKRLHEQVR